MSHVSVNLFFLERERKSQQNVVREHGSIRVEGSLTKVTLLTSPEFTLFLSLRCIVLHALPDLA